MQSLDVGCGFRERHKKRGLIGVDLVKGKCDVVADAETLPFQNQIFDKVFLDYVLEHLDNPLKCLREVVRVSKSNAHVDIIIPVEANVWKNRLKSLIVGFPVSVSLLYKAMIRYVLYERKDW